MRHFVCRLAGMSLLRRSHKTEGVGVTSTPKPRRCVWWRREILRSAPHSLWRQPVSAAATYTLVKCLWATQRNNPSAVDCTDDTCLIDQFTICLVFCENLSTRGKFKTPPARNPATSIPRAIKSLFIILLILFSSYFLVQLFQPRCLLCSQQLVYNINTSLMRRLFRANHEILLPRLNQAGWATLNYFWGNLPCGCDLQFLFMLLLSLLFF